MLVYGLPAESATWRHKELPPVERLLDALLQQHYDIGMAQLAPVLGKKRLKIPGPPNRLLPPGAEPPKLENVVSIAEFAERHARREAG